MCLLYFWFILQYFIDNTIENNNAQSYFILIVLRFLMLIKILFLKPHTSHMYNIKYSPPGSWLSLFLSWKIIWNRQKYVLAIEGVWNCTWSAWKDLFFVPISLLVSNNFVQNKQGKIQILRSSFLFIFFAVTILGD